MAHSDFTPLSLFYKENTQSFDTSLTFTDRHDWPWEWFKPVNSKSSHDLLWAFHAANCVHLLFGSRRDPTTTQTNHFRVARLYLFVIADYIAEQNVCPAGGWIPDHCFLKPSTLSQFPDVLGCNEKFLLSRHAEADRSRRRVVGFFESRHHVKRGNCTVWSSQPLLRTKWGKKKVIIAVKELLPCNLRAMMVSACVRDWRLLLGWLFRRLGEQRNRFQGSRMS